MATDPGQSRRAMTPGRRILNLPFTGNGRTGGPKPRLADTNLGNGTKGEPTGQRFRIGPWIRGGKHSA